MDTFEITALVGGLILLGFGGLCLLAPQKAKAAHIKCLPGIVRWGRCATPCQEKILCRIAGAGLLVLAFVLLKGMF